MEEINIEEIFFEWNEKKFSDDIRSLDLIKI
jgi:hypothetical protein